MTNKIKIIVTLLIVGAVFSVYSTGKFLFDLSPGKAAISQTSPLPAPNQDVDNDGLSNRDESYWNTDFQNPDTDGDGFLDGEEVASGHDPTKPGPDDILSAPENLTDKMQSLIVGGLYSGDLKPDSKKFGSSVDNISAVIVDDFYKFHSFPRPQLRSAEDSIKNQEIYLTSVAGIIEKAFENSYTNIGSKENADAYIALISSFGASLKIALEDLISIPVPTDWQEIHYSLLDIINRSIKNYEAIGSYNTDPYKAYLALDDTKNIDIETRELFKQIKAKIDKNKLKLDDSTYNIFKLYYK